MNVAPHSGSALAPLPTEPAAGVRARPVKLMLLTVGLGVGGTEGHVLELASRLDRSRFEVTVCTLKGDDVIAEEIRQRGVRIVALGGHGKLDARILWNLWQLIRKERPEIIHAFLFWANLACRLVGRLLRAPVRISSYHDVELRRVWYRLLADRLTSGWTHVMACCSDAVRRSVLSQVRGEETKYVTIPFGVDIHQFDGGSPLRKQELGLQDGLAVIGTVCRLIEPKKGLRTLLQAVALLKAQPDAPAFQLLIVGDGPAAASLRELSARMGIAPWVVFAGMRRDIPRLLPLLDLFVLPSLAEGLGIAILEAMAARRAVVATAVGGIPEVVVHGQTGLLVPPGDPVELAAAMHELLTHPEQASAMGAQGRERVREKFCIRSVVRQHEELYEGCLTRGKA